MRVLNKAIILGLFAVGLSTAASASTLDFKGYAGAIPPAGGEQGVTNGTSITSPFFDGETVTFSSTSTLADPSYAYFDNGAGLGVCNNLNGSLQCDPANDDNIQSGETVTFSLAGLFNLSGIVLRAEGHGILGDAKSVGIDVGNGWEYHSYGELKNMSFSGISSASFGFGGSNADQFYVSSATVSAVPVPAAAGLLIAGLGGLGGLGFVGRRKRKQAT